MYKFALAAIDASGNTLGGSSFPQRLFHKGAELWTSHNLHALILGVFPPYIGLVLCLLWIIRSADMVSLQFVRNSGNRSSQYSCDITQGVFFMLQNLNLIAFAFGKMRELFLFFSFVNFTKLLLKCSDSSADLG